MSASSSRLRTALAVAFVLIALTPALASAEDRPAEAPARTMTLDEALAYARTHHYRVRAARERIKAAEREAEIPGAQWLPRIGAMAQVVGATTNNSTTTLLGNAAVDLPRVGATVVSGDYSMTPYPSTAAAIGVRQQIYDFGRVAAERAAAELLAAAERQRGAGAALDVELGVRQAYYAVLASTAIGEASKAAFARAASHRDLARANVQSGMRPPIELTRAEADVARYEASMMRANANVRVAQTMFAAAVGVDDDELGAAPASAPPAPLPTLSDVLTRAAATPAVLESKARADAQKAETRRLDAQTRPTLSATAAISGRGGGAPPNSGPTPYGEGWLPVVPNYSGAIVLTWPIFEPTWERRSDASRERELAASSEAGLALRNARAAIAAAYREAVVADETLGAAERGSDAARANWDQAEHRFGVGLGTSTELADAQALRTEADIQLAIAKFQRARARAVLARATAEANLPKAPRNER